MPAPRWPTAASAGPPLLSEGSPIVPTLIAWLSMIVSDAHLIIGAAATPWLRDVHEVAGEDDHRALFLAW